jgi:hypothetical protein
MNVVLCVLVLMATPRVQSRAAEQAVTPLPTIEVTASKDAALVRALSDTISALSQKVTSCVNAGGAIETCRCSDPRDANQLKEDYERLMKQRPAWKDKLLSYRYINKEGRSVSGTLVLQNVRRQLETLKCK